MLYFFLFFFFKPDQLKELEEGPKTEKKSKWYSTVWTLYPPKLCASSDTDQRLR